MDTNKLKEAANLAKQGCFPEARQLYEELVVENPKDPIVLYNLGMCFTELDQPEKAIVALNRSLEFDLSSANTFVALGYAYSRLNKIEEAKNTFLHALEIEPDNSYALRNLGGLYGKLGDPANSFYCLKRAYEANPSDPITVYGLAYAYQQSGDLEKADEFYRKLLTMDAPSNLVEQAKTGLREIAVKNLKSSGIRMDAVMYMVSALKLFKKSGEEKTKQIAFEIAMKGRSGLEVNNPDIRYTLKSIPGEFSGLQLVSYMFAGFKQIAPEQNVGVDLSKEYEMALSIFGNKGIS